MRSRRGLTTTEMVCAALLTGVVLAMVVPGLHFISRENTAAANHLDATVAVGNVLDEITARPYENVTPGVMKDVEVPEWIVQQLKQPKLDVRVTDSEGGKLVSAELSWLAVHGAAREKVRMHVWIYERSQS